MTPPTMTIEDMEKELSAFEEVLAGFRTKLDQLRTAKRGDWEWMSVKEASRKLGCTPQHVYHLADSGKVKSTREFGKLLVAIKETK